MSVCSLLEYSMFSGRGRDGGRPENIFMIVFLKVID